VRKSEKIVPDFIIGWGIPLINGIPQPLSLQRVMPSMFRMLSLEEYLETAAHRSLNRFSDGLSQQDDVPLFTEIIPVKKKFADVI